MTKVCGPTHVPSTHRLRAPRPQVPGASREKAASLVQGAVESAAVKRRAEQQGPQGPWTELRTRLFAAEYGSGELHTLLLLLPPQRRAVSWPCMRADRGARQQQPTALRAAQLSHPASS